MRQISQAIGVVLLLLAASLPAQAQLDVEAALADRVMGDADAPVTMIEYASLTCPHCAAFHGGTLKELKTEYIDTGKVKLIYRDFPLDQNALMGSMVARCSGKDRYFGFIDILFRSQSNWARSSDPQRSLMQIGRLGGMGAEEIEACFANEELLDGIVNMRQEGSQVFNVQSTPSFIINGELHSGNLPFEDLAKIIDPLIPTN